MFSSAMFDVLILAVIYDLLNNGLTESIFIDRVESFVGVNIDDFLSVIVIVIVISLGGGIKIFTQYRLANVVNKVRHLISKKLFSIYQNKEYKWYTNNVKSEVSAHVITEVDQLSSQVLVPLGNVLVQMVSAVFIILYLSSISFNTVSISIVTLIIIYSIVMLSVRRVMSQLGRRRLELNKERFYLVSIASSYAKFVKAHGLADFFLKRYEPISSEFSNVNARTQSLTAIPRFVIELLLFVSIVLFIGLSEILFNDPLDLATFAIFGLAAIKLIPTAQGLYSAYNRIHIAYPSVISIYREISDSELIITKIDKPNVIADFKKIDFSDISFKYNNNSEYVIENFSYSITKGDFVGIVGKTGGGKSTLLDIIMGLQVPASGVIHFDGESAELRRDLVSYVPQETVLLNETVYSNVFFDIDDSSVDPEYFEMVIRACALNTIMDQFDKSTGQVIGDNGSKLSGGQRQRIALARALIRKPKLLVLDEATSALDPDTERHVLSSISDLIDGVIIYVTHNRDTLLHCNRVLTLGE